MPVDEGKTRYDSTMAPYYVKYRKIPEPIVEWVVRAGQITPGSRVLDLAAGTGNLANQLARVSRRVTGVEVSKSFIAAARASATELGVRTEYVQGDANQFEIGGEPYDCVTLCQAFHWLQPAAVIRCIHRALDENGLLFVIDSNVRLPVSHPLRELFSDECNQSVGAAMYRTTRSLLEPTADGRFFAVVTSFRYTESRRIDLNYARAYHANPPNYWYTQARELADVPPGQFAATVNWLGVMFAPRSVSNAPSEE
ncbi:MAG: class I SAM-dependent methyltransferase [Planctomycetaceae bacterium]|nr:class I SAM-dependent methyltransferase [Planctomycetaceae bacterium]